MRLDFWFDYSCPFAYAASALVEGVAARTGADLVYRPCLLGGVFRAVGTAQNLATTLSPQKALHTLHDQQRALVRAGLPLAFPLEHPRRTVHALRATLAAARLGDARLLVRAYFRAYWAEGQAIEDESVVRAIAAKHGFPDLDLEAERERLKRETDAAIEAGVFGAPAFVIHAPDAAPQLYWGHDRLDFVERALHDPRPPWPPTTEPLSPPSDAVVDAWLDYASPFAYLANTQLRGLAARTGAALRLRPFLLGALFKSVGQVDVPFFGFSDAKRLWYVRDLHAWAERWGAPFHWSPHFPLRTVSALRCTLAHPDPLAFSERVFKAAWADGLDISDPDVLVELGGDPAAAEGQRDALFRNTQEALDTGVFGTPTFIVRRPGAPAQRFWGQDRLSQVEDVLRGWLAPGDLN